MKNISKFCLNYLIIITIILGYISFPQKIYAQEDVSSLLKENIHSIKLLQDGEEKTDIDPSKPVNLKVKFKIPSQYDEPTPDKYVKKSDKAKIVLAQNLDITDSKIQDIIINTPEKEEKKLGKYQFVKEGTSLVLKIDFDDEENLLSNPDYNDFQAEASIDLKIDSTGIPDNGKDLIILGNEFKILVPSDINIEKTGEINPENQSVKWTIKVTGTRSGKDIDLEGYKIVDYLVDKNNKNKTAGEYIKGSFQINGKAIDNIDITEVDKIKYQFPNGSMSPQVITFETSLTPEEFRAKNVETIKYNTVEIFNKNDVYIKNDFNYVNWKPVWASKDARVDDSITPNDSNKKYYIENGEYFIDWEIIVNGFEEKYSKKIIYAKLKGVKIEDELQKQLGASKELEYISSKLEDWDPNLEKWINERPIPRSFEPTTNTDIPKTVYNIGDIEKRVKLTIKSKIKSPVDMSVNNRFKNVAFVWWDEISVYDRIPASSEINFGGIGITKDGEQPRDKLLQLDPNADLGWTGSLVTWKINLPKEVVKNDTKVYDMMLYNAEVNYTNWKEEKDYKLLVDPNDPNASYLKNIDVNSLRPEDLKFNKLDKDFVLQEIKSKNLKARIYSIKDTKERNVADLLEVSGFKENTDYEFFLKSTLVGPRNLLNNNHIIDNMVGVNTAYLVQGNDIADFDSHWIGHTSKMLDKSVLTAEDAKLFKEDYKSDKLNNNLKNNKDNAFNHNTKSVIYRLSLNADNNKNTKESLGTLTLTDILPQGWSLVDIKPGKEFLIFEGNPIKETVKVEDLHSFDANVKAIGEPIENLDGLSFIKNDRELEFNFENIDKPYVIVFEAKINDDKFKEYIKQSGEVINTATLKSEKVEQWTIGETKDTQAVKVNPSIFDKKLEQSKEHGMLKWVVDYNPYDIVKQKDKNIKIFLRDTMSEGIEPIRNENGDLDFSNDNIIIEKLKMSPNGTLEPDGKITNDEVKSLVSYDEKTRQLKFIVQDSSQAYRFTYITEIFEEKGENVSNQVDIVGSNMDEINKPKINYPVKDYDFMATMKRNPWLMITKVDEENNNRLSGAEFALINEMGETVKKGTTKNDGKLLLKGIKNGSYKLREIHPPQGYKLDNTEYEVVVDTLKVPVVSINKQTDENSHKITISNSKKKKIIEDGQIEISKEVEGNPSDTNEFEFTFKLTNIPDGASSEYKYEKTNSKDDKIKNNGNFFLSNGQKILIKGLPRGVEYKIEEKDYSSEHYKTISENDSGNIEDNNLIKVRFINKKEVLQVTTSPSLKIEKEILGNAKSLDDSFRFKINFETDKSKEYIYTIDGVEQTDKMHDQKEFRLKGGQSLIIKDIEAEQKFKIEEIDYLDYEIDENSRVQTISITTDNNLNLVKFVNTKNLGKLTMKKIVTGEKGELDKEFNFTIKIGNDPNKIYNYTDENGVKGSIKAEDTIRLRHNQTITIQGIKTGTAYEVYEDDYKEQGYTTTSTGNTGIITTGESIAEFVNDKKSSTDEGSSGGGGGPSGGGNSSGGSGGPSSGGDTPTIPSLPETERPQPNPQRPNSNITIEEENEVPRGNTNTTEDGNYEVIEDERIPEGIEKNQDDIKIITSEEQTPKSTPKSIEKLRLPKTATEQNNYYLIGFILLGIGIFLKRRNSK